MQIIDAHHHIWRQADLTWLQGPTQPRIFGDYDAIKRDYPISEYLDDIRGSGVIKSVYVQANWPVEKFAAEAAWIEEVAAESGWPHGLVAYADFTADDVRPQLQALEGFPLMRGLRQQFHWHENELYRFASRADLPADRTVQRNIARLADFGWSFDLQVFDDQMTDAAALARACRDVTFILQHAGMPEDLSPAGWTKWRDNMKRLAAVENIVVKLSAFGTFVHRNDPELIAAILGETVEMFGSERCLFGSNFPIEKLWTSYGDLIAAFLRAAADLPESGQRDIFHDTAARVYRL
jgi:predicted TIM-barrel fold metal-dependent hydrolase